MPITYDIERNGAIVATEVAAKSFEDEGLPNGTYTYRVRARNEFGAGEWSQPVVVEVDVEPEEDLLIDETFEYEDGELEAANPSRWSHSSGGTLSVASGSVGISLSESHDAEDAVYKMLMPEVDPNFPVRVEVDIAALRCGNGSRPGTGSGDRAFIIIGLPGTVSGDPAAVGLEARSSFLPGTSGQSSTVVLTVDEIPVGSQSHTGGYLSTGTLILRLDAGEVSGEYAGLNLSDETDALPLDSTPYLWFRLAAWVSEILGGEGDSTVTVSAIRVYGTAAGG